MFIRNLFIVGCGGFLGSMFRYAVSGWAQKLSPAHRFPVGTLSVNVIGCLAIGVFAGLADRHGLLGPNARLFWVVGLLGGFTTFSAFGNETVTLLRNGHFLPGMANVALQVILGLAAVVLGYGVVSAR